ncbi:c-type cytochrome [Flavobacterium sp. SUN046]|uniref:c-type cytochrome n=1 Tax=Flavobacterium sp. SUN046 TaxID=3002440 RepID=UPI002DBEE7E6|nr:c-type cytochrome [Flavobacterium sp. SUN046]MEC4048066.1 c-type cytochrome [Flavobacterium sp. SUN046]
MKTLSIKLSIGILILALWSCGGNKKEDQYGNPAGKDDKKTTEDTAFPLAEKGKAIFEGKGTCITCHKPDLKLVGPSLVDISKIYTEKKGNIVNFLKGEAEPIVDPSQFEVMKANFALTKTFSNEELQSLEQYIYSQK